MQRHGSITLVISQELFRYWVLCKSQTRDVNEAILLPVLFVLLTLYSANWL
jgi:hypothetical protein